MPRKKSTSASEQTPMLAYTTKNSRDLKLAASTMGIFEDYAKYFEEKTGYKLESADVLSSKATALYLNPEQINVAKIEEKNQHSLSLPNSAWSGIDQAAKYHGANSEAIVDRIAEELCEDSSFQRWYKKNAKTAKMKLH